MGEAASRFHGRTLTGRAKRIAASAGGRAEGRLELWWGDGDGGRGFGPAPLACA